MKVACVCQFTPTDTHGTAPDVLGQSEEGSQHNRGDLKGYVNKEVVQSERLYCQNQALTCKNKVFMHRGFIYLCVCEVEL